MWLCGVLTLYGAAGSQGAGLFFFRTGRFVMCFCRGVDNPYDLLGEFESFDEAVEAATRDALETFPGSVVIHLVESE